MSKLTADISIIVVNYNRSNYIERCLRSCIDQVIFNKNFEIIFVDDASKDDSFEIAKKFRSSIRLFRLKKNKGISYASNFALKKSNGKYFIRVDSDDYINKHTIDYMSEILINNKNIAFVYCDHYRVDEFGNFEKNIRLKNREILKNHGAGIMFNKNIFKNYGGYNHKLKEAEDYEILDKILNKEKVFY